MATIRSQPTDDPEPWKRPWLGRGLATLGIVFGVWVLSWDDLGEDGSAFFTVVVDISTRSLSHFLGLECP